MRILKHGLARQLHQLIVATKKSIRLRILKHISEIPRAICGQATKKSIRLRILKLGVVVCVAGVAGGYKKIDPFADTETRCVRCRGLVVPPGYKKIDPFADTETGGWRHISKDYVGLQKNRSVCGY